MPYLFDIKVQTKKVRPSDASVCQINLPSHPDRKVVARFDGGRLSSEAVSVRPGSTARTDGWLCLLHCAQMIPSSRPCVIGCRKGSGSGFSTHAVATGELGGLEGSHSPGTVAATYLKHRKKSRPEKIILDIDSTDDVTHGQQEFSFYHGYYREHMYHPLLLFDGETGEVLQAPR